MKKSLLFAAGALALGMSASAQVFPQATEITGTDYTPYWNFNETGARPSMVTLHAMNWNMSVEYIYNNIIVGDIDATNGVFLVGGPQCNNNEENVAKAIAGTTIQNFGGTLGKVLVINSETSGLQDYVNANYGFNMDIPSVPNSNGYMQYFMVPNPETLFGAPDDLRVRIEYSIFKKVPGNSPVWNAYMQSDQNNVMPVGDEAAPGIQVNSEEFAYRWCDKDPDTPDDDGVWDNPDGDGNAAWNPYRYQCYEWDFKLSREFKDLAEGEPGDVAHWKSCPKLKFQIEGLADNAILIRRIAIFPRPADAIEYNINNPDAIGRLRTWNTYTMDAAGVEIVGADMVAPNYSVCGNNVTFEGDAQVYTAAGAQVVHAAAGQAVNLPAGLYIARVNGQAVKFVVK